MPIQALSESDIRALGSPLVLHDARSVIKELIENALDSNADTISVEISANTIDIIQVRDNGSGIGAEDRDLLCKRGCTSKIRTIQDLENLGGSSLGFRGEALASIAELSNGITVTTRIDGEPVALTVRFGANGQPISSSSASHPIGTTIRVQDFLRTIPVRRQTALKEAARTLSDTKKILQAYSFARPSVRISFKVLKAKNDKYSWTYGPNPGSTTLLSATAKIVGPEAAVQCEARLWKSGAEGEFGDAHVVDAVVVKEGGDHVKVCSKGQFISIDGRPISTTRGVFKDFVKLYKVYYRNRISGARSTGGLIDPFLVLQLRCPAGSYDVNIEPAKDEVLFADASNVLKLLEDFLKSVYGSLPEKSERKSPLDSTGALSITQSQPFGLLLARKEQHLKESPGDASERDHMPGVISRIDAKYPKESLPEKEIPAASESAELSFVEDVPSARQRPSTGNAKLHRNMFDFDEDDMSSMERPLSPEGNCNSGSDDAELRKASITNPWTIAKLNAPILSANGSPLNRSSGNSIEQLMAPGPDSGVSDGVSTSRTQTFGQVTNLPSPAGSDISLSPPPYQNPGSPIRRRAPLHVDDEIEFTQETADNSHTRGHPTSLDQWVKPRAHKVHLTSFHRASEIIDTDNRSKHQNDQIDDCDGNAPTGIQSTQLTEPVEDTCHKLQSRNQIKKPLIPPFKTPERALALLPPLELKPTFSRQSGTQSPACQPGVPGQHNLRNTSPSSHAHPPPLSHLHQHPMASPPRLQPSSPLLSRRSGLTNRTPNLELDEIMDFEHRKKAVNAQRNGQTKLTNRYLNPGQLSQIQRASAASLQVGNRVLTSSSPLRKLPAPNVNVRDETEKSYNPARPVDRHFPDPYRPLNQETADIASLRQSPHQNRYQAAKAALTGPKPPNLLSSAQSPAEHESAFENTNSIEIIPLLPKTDPRTYLMQHRSASPNPKTSHDPSTVPSFTRPGLKIKRAKTSKLPFETIPAEYATYNLSTKPATSLFPSTENFTVRINDLDGVDDYIRTGKNQFVVWDADSMAVSAWEEEIVRLVRQGNVAKKAGSAVASREELTTADLQLRLNEALRAHREEFA